jgi:ADP-ribosylglycohydrolase
MSDAVPEQTPTAEQQASGTLSDVEGQSDAPPITQPSAESDAPPTTQPSADSDAPPTTTHDSRRETEHRGGDSDNDTKTTPTASEATPPVDPSPSVEPVFQDNWSKLSRDVITDKIKGIIYGEAIGDALGLATEFMTQKEAVRYYGKDGPKEYSKIIQDFHRSRWMKGDWTDDTDQLLLILQMIVERKGSVEKCAFAEKMSNWRKNGFKELGDVGGMGIGMTVSQTLSHPVFLTEPHEAAKDVWERSGRYLAANGAIMRTAILGVLEFNKLERVKANTREVCLVTHADPRCLASCTAVTTAIALILQGAYDPCKKVELNRLVTEAIEHGQAVLEHDDQRKELVTHVKASKLEDLDLDNRRTMG